MVSGEKAMRILSTLLDIVTVVLRLLEAEGRLLRRSVMNLGWALAFVGIAALLLIASAAFFLAGAYQYLAALTSPAAASFLVSLVALALALIFAVVAKRRVADPK
jgi:hypothetical protein